MIKHLKENEFDSAINKDLVLVDFYAEWCGPCKMLCPVLEELSNERSLEICKINVDECENLSRNLGIMSIPTLLLYSNGKLITRHTGFMTMDEIKNWIEENK